MIHSITVPLPPEQAFRRFTEQMADWWPPDYTWAQQTLQAIAVEPLEGGRRGRGQLPSGDGVAAGRPLMLGRYASL